MTISIVTQPSPYTHDHGDIIYGDYDQFIKKLNKKTLSALKAKEVLHLRYLGAHPWRALESMPDINEMQVKLIRTHSTYTCPITGFNHTALLPIAVFTDSVSELLQPMQHVWWYDLACDHAWNKSQYDPFDVELSDTEIILLGLGYTDMCMPNDGNSSLNHVVMDLDNGDSILCYAQVWHNK